MDVDPMEVIEAIKKRRSVRSYQKRNIPEREVEEILNAARLAPSAKNKQDWKFVVVTDMDKKEKLYRAAYGQEFVKEVPIVIAGVSLDINYVMACGVPSGYADLAIALDHISLAATEKGLGTCWIGHFNQKEAKRILEIPDEYEIVSLMTLGYPTEPLVIRKKNRKNMEEIVCYDVFKKEY